jgi:hypothetical protein
MWILSGKIIASPRPILIGDVNYSRNIFKKWSIEKLAELGISPFREAGFNSQWFRSTGTIDTLDDNGTMVRSHTLVPLHDDNVAKTKRFNQIRSLYVKLKRKATEYEDFYDAIGDSVNKKVWGDYGTALKDDAKLLRDSVDAAETYEEIIYLQFVFTQSPEGSEPGPI